MKLPIRIAGTVLFLALAAPSAHAACNPPPAGVPPPHDVPNHINLVGLSGGVPDVRGEFQVVLRDLDHNPIAECEVSIDFRDCWGIRLSTNQPWPGTTLSCELNEHGWPFAVIRAATDATGTATFRIVGGSVNAGDNTPANALDCARVYAGPSQISLISIGAFDQNGTNGVGPVDIALWLADAFDADFEGRSDYDATESIGPSDLSLLIGVSLRGGSASSGTSYCQ